MEGSNMSGAAATFDREAWRRAAGNRAGDSRRGGMVDAARAAGLVEGASRDAVLDLLGEPDERRPGIDRWYLGRSAFGPSFEALDVQYGAGQTVSAIRLSRS